MTEVYLVDRACAYELRRRNAQFAVVGLCMGGGKSIAMVIEHV